MRAPQELPRYDLSQTYRWNYDHAPVAEPPAEALPVPGHWSFCGLQVDSPLGIPAGPLLNGRWVLYYAALGFDVLTYKTVRSQARECYPLPNLVPVDVTMMHGGETDVPIGNLSSGSWAVSFGMPSMDPSDWRSDIEWTRTRLPSSQILSVSVVGTMQPGWGLNELADDYARCARWAVASGADCVETNFSCPNVSTCDGQLYQHATDAARVAERVRDAIGQTPYIMKIGHVSQAEEAARLLEEVAPFIDGLAMTNSIATRVVDAAQAALFDGQPRGICGRATRAASMQQVRLFARQLASSGQSLDLIGVGGAGTAADVRDYLHAGASAVHIATAAMLDPTVALQIRRELNAAPTG